MVFDYKLNVNPSEIRRAGSGIDIPVIFRISYNTVDPRDGSKSITYQ